ncbi:serine hydrolase domain-containing protein [Kitasatospora kifunensis]|uniref:D-alanyl-D-alanine carboxypeptidase n=1 Tax=Kitasatospora kifunensis TaxID=58351 RepID=A0A7W7RAG3_KITKI|nr:serine hydrolase domain-containing protein [Kitasatospora kifunensis]MBB4927731.1 D-alanyl-D-alanine carboxypeptidase [Kitasatospora kifunensis]
MNALKRRLAPLALATAALATAMAVPAAAAVPNTATPNPATPNSTTLNTAALDAAVALQPSDHTAGQVARVSTPDQVWQGSSTNAFTGRGISPDAHFHIGSMSKTFVAVVLLQLEAEHQVDLDQTVQYYLPNTLPASYPAITVRQLLDHTSGLPAMSFGVPNPTVDQVLDERLDYFTFDDIIKASLFPADGSTPPLHFTPGTKQEYSSLGYRVAGAVIERVTGRSFSEEVTARVLHPLHLDQTSAPAGKLRVPRPALHGYVTDSTGQSVDVTEQGDDSGAMISTTADLDHFVSALYSGQLLAPAQQDELFALPHDGDGKPVPYVDGSDCNTGPAQGQACYGVGLKTITLPNGTTMWGKTGHDLGYAGGFFATRDLSLRVVYDAGTATSDSPGTPAVANRLIAAVLSPSPQQPSATDH